MDAEPLDSHLSSILIVDDEPDICLALEDLLRHAGYTVRSVMTGREALHEAEQSLFGAVILDLGLPDLSGFAVLRGLEELDPLLPVIVLTASVQDSVTVESLRRGAAAYITKPYNPEALKIILRQAVDARRLALKMHRAERALGAREEQFRHVCHAAPDGIVLADDDGKIVSWNTAAERLFGYTEGEMLGQPLTTIMPSRYREDHQRGLERARSLADHPCLGERSNFMAYEKTGVNFPLRSRSAHGDSAVRCLVVALSATSPSGRWLKRSYCSSRSSSRF